MKALILSVIVALVLVNSNPATIMTDPEFADHSYVEPITAEVIEAIMEREKPDATAMAQTQMIIDDTELEALYRMPPQLILVMLGQPTEISGGPPMLQYTWCYKNNGSPLCVTIQDGKVLYVDLATYGIGLPGLP